MALHALLEAVNKGDIPLILDLLAESRPLDLNTACPWDASITTSPFSKPSSPRPPPTIKSEKYECTALNLAVLSGNKAIVRILLQNGADPNREDSRKRNSLVCALYGIDSLKMQQDTFAYLSYSLPDHLDLIKILIPHMVISSMNKPLDSLRGTSVLCFACYLGKVEAVKLLLNCEHISINAADCKGASALMYAVREGHQVIVRELVKHGAKPELTNREGFSSIQYARNAPIITFELEKSLSLHRLRTMDPTQYSGPTASFISELSKILKEDHISLLPDSHSRELGKVEPIINESHQALLSYIQQGQVEKVQHTIAAYFKPPIQPLRASILNFHDKVTGLTPAHKAICNGNDSSLSIIESLYLAGADFNASSWSGRTPLHHLCILAVQPASPTENSLGLINSSPQFLSALASRMMDLGSSLAAKDKKGKTPLHYLVKGDDSIIPLIDIFLERGANLSTKDLSNKTPIDCAESSSVIRYLVDFQQKKVSKPSSPVPLLSVTPPTAGASVESKVIKGSTESKVPLTLNDSIQDFLDQYRIFDSTIILEYIPRMADAKSLVKSQVIAGGTRHQFYLKSQEALSSFSGTVELLSNCMETTSQLYSSLNEKQENIVNTLHSSFSKLSHTKDSLISKWRHGSDSLPQLKLDLKGLASRLGRFSSECSFLIKAFNNKRQMFTTEFQRQMLAQKSSVQHNNDALTTLVEKELDVIKEFDLSDDIQTLASEEKDDLGQEGKLKSLYVNSKEVKSDLNRIKAKLSELRDQKDIVLTEFSNQSDTKSTTSFSIPMSDLAFQAEVLTGQHEGLLANLERRIDDNERVDDEIRNARATLYGKSPNKQLKVLIGAKKEHQPLQRSNSTRTVDSLSSSKKLIDLMLQIQAIDLALFSLNTWVPYRLGSLRRLASTLEVTIDKLLNKVDDFKCNITWAEEHTAQLRQSIHSREIKLQQTVRSREGWISRAKQSVEEAQHVCSNTESSHSLKYWPWDFETSFRQCQVSDLEESCLVLSSDLETHSGHLNTIYDKLSKFASQLKFQDQYFQTKLHSSDPKKPGAFQEIQQLESYLDKIKARDVGSQGHYRSRSHSVVFHRTSSIFGTLENIPLSPTSPSSASGESGYDSLPNKDIISGYRQSTFNVFNDPGFMSRRTSLGQNTSRYSSLRSNSDDRSFSHNRSSLFNHFRSEETSDISNQGRLRRSSSSFGLQIAPDRRHTNTQSQVNLSDQSSRRTLRYSGSTTSLASRYNVAPSTPILPTIKTRVQSSPRASASSQRLSLSPTEYSTSQFSNRPSTSKPFDSVKLSPRQRVQPNLRRIYSEIHPGTDKAPNSQMGGLPSKNNTNQDSRDRLISLLSDARREVEILEKLTTASSSDVDNRQHSLLVKKKVQVRQIGLALQRMSRDKPLPLFNKQNNPPATIST